MLYPSAEQRIEDWKTKVRFGFLAFTRNLESTDFEGFNKSERSTLDSPSFYLLRVILRPYHQVLELGEDAHHLRARHRIAAEFGPSQSRRDVSNVASYVIPAVLSQRHGDFDRLAAVLLLAVRYAHPIVTLGASKLHDYTHVTSRIIRF